VLVKHKYKVRSIKKNGIFKKGENVQKSTFISLFKAKMCSFTRDNIIVKKTIVKKRKIKIKIKQRGYRGFTRSLILEKVKFL
jgi:hypothetical protein